MSPIKMSKIESALRMAVEYIDAFNKREKERLIKIIDKDCIFQLFGPPPDGETIMGEEEIKKYIENEFTRESIIEVEDIIGFGNKCIVLLIWKWPDRQKNHLRGIDLIKEKDGKIVEKFSYVKGNNTK